MPRKSNLTTKMSHPKEPDYQYSGSDSAESSVDPEFEPEIDSEFSLNIADFDSVSQFISAARALWTGQLMDDGSTVQRSKAKRDGAIQLEKFLQQVGEKISIWAILDISKLLDDSARLNAPIALKILLNNDKNIDTVLNYQAKRSFTALHIAVCEGHDEIVRTFIQSQYVKQNYLHAFSIVATGKENALDIARNRLQRLAAQGEEIRSQPPTERNQTKEKKNSRLIERYKSIVQDLESVMGYHPKKTISPQRQLKIAFKLFKPIKAPENDQYTMAVAKGAPHKPLTATTPTVRTSTVRRGSTL